MATPKQPKTSRANRSDNQSKDTPSQPLAVWEKYTRSSKPGNASPTWYLTLRNFYIGTIVVIGIWLMAVAERPGTSVTETSPESTRAVASSLDVTVSGNDASNQSYYLDGNYGVTLTVYHSSEQCRLAVYARGPEESIGSTIYQGMVVGNSGTLPDYSQTFNWDSVYFSEETVRIVSASACDRVRVQLRRE